MDINSGNYGYSCNTNYIHLCAMFVMPYTKTAFVCFCATWNLVQYEGSKEISLMCQQNLSTVENKWVEKCLLLLIKVQVLVGFWFLAIDELMTPEEKAKLFTAIGYSDSSHHLSLPKQVSKFLWGLLKKKQNNKKHLNKTNQTKNPFLMHVILKISSRMCVSASQNHAECTNKIKKNYSGKHEEWLIFSLVLFWLVHNPNLE